MSESSEAVSTPIIGITMGDPGGVGPEIICKALSRGLSEAAWGGGAGIQPVGRSAGHWEAGSNIKTGQVCRPVVIGSAGVMQGAAEQFAPELTFVAVDSISDAVAMLRGINEASAAIPVFSPPELPPDSLYTMGEIAAANGEASHACIVAAARAALDGEIHAICTAPIAKEALFKAGFRVPGHTELLASLCDAPAVRMMLVGGGLNVVLQTIHVALAEVPSLIGEAGILESLHIIEDFAGKTGAQSPRIAVCGLNPHAGEGGHFGNEEQTIIEPALAMARAAGMNVTGALPADTVFHRALQGEFDFVLAMYHDQGLIPVKTLDFHGGVNVTLGLPIIRTSPDHGTAFGIAGRGIAHEGSMIAAIRYAAQIATGNLG